MTATVLTLAFGLLIVVGGILILRLHAFVALTLAALVVAAATSQEAVVRSQLLTSQVTVRVEPTSEAVSSAMLPEAERPVRGLLVSGQALDESVPWKPVPQGQLSLADAGAFRWKLSGMTVVDAPPESAGAERFYRYVVEYLPVDASQAARSPAWISTERSSFQIVAAAEWDRAERLGRQGAVKRVTDALGAVCGNLAILIVSASIIGYALLHSGAADRIVHSMLSLVGEKGAPVAFSLSGFVLAIPVFFDTVFLLMLPLAKSIYGRTRRNYLLSVLSIIAGATMAHSLVPPTPGPLLIADQFGVSTPAMILGGSVVGLIGALCGLSYGWYASRGTHLIPPEYRDAGATSAEKTPLRDVAASLTGATAVSPVNSPGPPPGPPLWEALLPVALPVVLLAVGAFMQTGTGFLPASLATKFSGAWKLFEAITERNVALIIGTFAALATLVRIRRPSRVEVAGGIQTAVTSAGSIILVTAAGGAFGKMMEQTSVAELLQAIPATSPVAILLAAFLVTLAVRTAQGSATVAMMTAAGIFGGLVRSGAAGVEPLYVALAVGCGSKLFAWMNDSGFLVITRVSGMEESDGLRYVTPMLAIAGIGAFLTVLAGALCFPNLP